MHNKFIKDVRSHNNFIQSAKILLLPSKYEIICVTLKNGNTWYGYRNIGLYWSDNYRYRDSWKSDNFKKEAIKKEAKNGYQKDAKRIKSDNFTEEQQRKINDLMAP